MSTLAELVADRFTGYDDDAQRFIYATATSPTSALFIVTDPVTGDEQHIRATFTATTDPEAAL